MDLLSEIVRLERVFDEQAKSIVLLRKRVLLLEQRMRDADEKRLAMDQYAQEQSERNGR